MKRFFRWLIGYEPPLCQKECKWEIISQQVRWWRRSDTQEEIEKGRLYTLQCKTCGLLKTHYSGV